MPSNVFTQGSRWEEMNFKGEYAKSEEGEQHTQKQEGRSLLFSKAISESYIYNYQGSRVLFLKSPSLLL